MIIIIIIIEHLIFSSKGFRKKVSYLEETIQAEGIS